MTGFHPLAIAHARGVTTFRHRTTWTVELEMFRQCFYPSVQAANGFFLPETWHSEVGDLVLLL